MLVYRLSIWSERGRIERDVECECDDALECIHAAGVIATGLQSGVGVKPERPTVWIERPPPPHDKHVSLVRDAHTHLKEAWLLLAHAGAQEAVSHVRAGLRLSRLSRS